MAISAPGIGSGLDINGLVGQLMALERRPLTALAQREASAQGRISAFGQLTSLVSSLQTAANGLKDTAKFAATKATVGANAGFTATSTTSASASSFSVEVSKLAQTQRVAVGLGSFALDNTDPAVTDRIAGGVLELRFGALPDLSGATPIPIDFAAGGSINDLRDAINNAKAGLRASVINDGTTQQLVLTGAETGAEQGFTLNGLGLTPADMAANEGAPVRVLQSAQNAEVIVDGLTITRSTNSISDVIEGVTLTLTRAETGAVSSLTVTEDRSAARAAIDGFVKAYNDAVTSLRNFTSFNAETRQASALTGDSAARSVQGQLRNIVGSVFEGLGDTTRLSDIGITFQVDGKLAVDNTKLTDALNDPERNVAAFFTGVEGSQGFAEKVSTALGNFVGSDGLISGRTEGLKASIKAIENQREALNRRLDSVESRIRAQFTALDLMIAGMTQTSSFLGQQLANLPGAFRGN